MPSWLQLISRVAAPAPSTRVFPRETAKVLKRKSPGGSLTSPPDSGTASIAACKLGYFAASITTAARQTALSARPQKDTMPNSRSAATRQEAVNVS